MTIIYSLVAYTIGFLLLFAAMSINVALYMKALDKLELQESPESSKNTLEVEYYSNGSDEIDCKFYFIPQNNSETE